MSLMDAYRRRTQASQAGGASDPFGDQGFVPTQPGDPDFSLAATPDSQAQFPAAAAEKRFYENQTRAQNFIQESFSQGYDINAPEYEAVRQAAERGFIDNTLTLGERLIGWIDGPRQFANLMLQDIAGGEAEEGKRNPGFFDYADAFFGGIENDDEFLRETGLNPISGSLTLELFGWEEEDDFAGKALRGVADFGLQVLIDPITYVTFGLSALGKKTARAAAMKASDDVTPNVVRAITTGDTAALDEYSRSVYRKMTDGDGINKFIQGDEFQPGLQNFTQNREYRDALMKYFKDKAGIDQAVQLTDDELMNLAMENVVELAVRNQVAKDIMQPLLRRDFSAIPDAALAMLPKYAHGGARIAFPFSRKTLEYGMLIPGSQGLGKKLLGDPLREAGRKLQKLPGGKKTWDWLTKISESSDVEKRLLKGVAEGRIAGWQYHILNDVRNRWAAGIDKEVLKTQINAAGNRLDELAEAAGIEDKSVLWGELINRMEGADLDNILNIANVAPHITGQGTLDPRLFDLDEELTEVANSLSTMMKSYYEPLAAFMPEFKDKFIRNYVPHIVNPDSGPVLREIAETAAVNNEQFIKAAQERGDLGPALLAMLTNAVGVGGRTESSVGGTRHMMRRDMGFTQAATISDMGAVMFSKDKLRELQAGVAPFIDDSGMVATDLLQASYIPITEMNRLMKPHIEELAERFNIVLPKNWDGKIFNENPLEVAVQYIDNLDEALSMWRTVDALTTAGLAFRNVGEASVPEIQQAIMRNVAEMTEDIVLQRRLAVSGSGEVTEIPGETLHQLEELVEAKAQMSPLQIRREQGREAVKAAGLNADDVAGNTKLYELAQMDIDELLAMRGKAMVADGEEVDKAFDFYRGLAENFNIPQIRQVNKKLAGWSQEAVSDSDGSLWVQTFRDQTGKPMGDIVVTFDNNGRLAGIDFTGNPELGRRERAEFSKELLTKFDELVIKSFPGALTYDNISRVVRESRMSHAGARMLQKFLRHKFSSMSDEALEVITNGGPAEYVRFQSAWGEFKEKMQELLTTSGQFYDPDTQKIIPISQNPQAKLVGDDEWLSILGDARRLAEETLGDKAAKRIFGGTSKLRVGLAEDPNFVNPALFGLGGPAAANMKFQSDVAVWVRQLARNASTIYTPEGIAALKVQTNNALRLWRAWATIARPSFHVRNLIGGVWNNQIIGVRLQDYAKVSVHGKTFRDALRSGVDFDDAIALLPKDLQSAFRAAWENDVLSGFVTTEFRKLVQPDKAAKLKFLNAADVDNFALTKFGGLAMESIEDFLRLSAFVRWYDPADPSTAKVAKEMVEAVHFNYTNLTPMETMIKSFVPFFVWTRRNLPLQLSVFAEQPRLVQRYRQMMQSMDDAFDSGPAEGEPAPDHFGAYAAGTGFYVNKGTPFWSRVMIDPDLPIRDLMELPSPNPQQLVEFANNLLGPHVTSLFDLNAQRDFGDVNAPGPINQILSSLSYVGLFDRTQSGDVRMPYYLRSILETAVPFSREVVEPIVGGPTDPGRQQSLGIGQDAGFLESTLKSLGMSVARGAGVKLTGPNDLRRVAARSSFDLNDLIEELRLEGKGAPRQDDTNFPF